MSKVRLYLARHGKTMFNTIGRAQGWSDTPLTAEGELGIHELGIGLRESGLQFDRAYSSDSGRTIQTMGIILEELGLQGKSLTVWISESVSGALVVLMGPMMGISLWGSFRVFSRWIMFISYPMPS